MREEPCYKLVLKYDIQIIFDNLQKHYAKYGILADKRVLFYRMKFVKFVKFFKIRGSICSNIKFYMYNISKRRPSKISQIRTPAHSQFFVH